MKNPMDFKWNDEHKPQMLNFMKDRDCIWRTTSEQYRNKTARKNAIQKNCARAGYAAGLSKVIKPHKNVGPIRHLHAEIVLVETRTPFLRGVCFF